jgi:hypothetical protein
MKLNWGQSITIVIILFMVFILTLVYKMHYRSADLVRDDYYEQEVNYDAKKQSIINYKNSPNKIQIIQKEEGVVIQFPDSILISKGHIQFYRADNKALDKNYDLVLNDSHQMILPYNDFKVGRYEVNISYTTPEGVAFLDEEIIDF